MRGDINSPYGPSRADRSIRNIPVPSGHRHHPSEEMYDQEPPRRPRGGRKWFWLSALLVVVVAAVGGFLLSTVFVGATVTVFPRTEQVTAPAKMMAGLNAGPGTLPYQNVSVTRSATTTVTATGTQHAERQASGKVTIYNNFSSASQRLIANTRFQAPDGKIYRVKDSVDVPGMGTAQATIFADSPGGDYNRTQSTKFTVPGFKGDPRYDKFYAEAESISGGFIGEEPAVAQADLDKARTAMEQALEAALREAAATGLPEGSIMIPGTLAISFSDLKKGAINGNSVTISEDSVAQGQIIRLQDLASYIARQTVKGYGGESVQFDDPSDITITLGSTTKATGSVELGLSGTPTLVWQFDVNAIKDALIGKPKGQFEDIIKSFEPAIAKAEAKIRPFWQTSFPADPSKIKVEVKQR
ncbi:hypothetical protein KW798_00705 [Candidatus Parcubacteria bacterium]|nr:hypothetical protein [Candidatus Parcubacteria bacterium]